MTLEEAIHKEILFEMQKVDTQDDKYLSALLHIEKMLKDGASIKSVKKYINGLDFETTSKDTLLELISQQQDNIGAELFKLSLMSVSGYTFLEWIKERDTQVKKALTRYVAQAEQILKENDTLKELIDNELKKYTRQQESFLRTNAKKAREYAYSVLDKSAKIKGWVSVAVLDNRTSAICTGLHGKFYSSKEFKTRLDVPNPPPRHPNCRSILYTVYENQEPNIKYSNVSDFLRENPQIGKDIMGKEKYAIFATGKAKVESFLDLKGKRWYRNDEIIKRFGIISKKRLDKIEKVKQNL